MVLQKWIWVSYAFYASPLSSWPTSQPMNNFSNGTAMFMKTIDLQFLNGVYLHGIVVGEI